MDLTGWTLEARAEMVLGILQETSEPTSEGTKLSTSLRLGFRREGHGWASICRSKASPPWNHACEFSTADAIHHWVVFHEGHRIGEVATAGWLSEQSYKDAGHLRITSAQVPQVGTRLQEFSGWSGGEVHRPLLAIEGGSDGYRAWTAATATERDKALLFPVFAKSVPMIPSCQTDANGKPLGRPNRTRIGDVEILPGRASGTKRLIGLRIKNERIKDCDGVGEAGAGHWYLVSGGGAVRALEYAREKNGWSTALVPIEVGDFDGSGRDEALFWYSGYNEDGYVFFYDGFSRTARFTWGYH
jgi:hypothetical protein